MDEVLLEKIEQKIHDSISNQDDVKELIKSLSTIDNSQSFALGIIVGRLYNTFFYQSKRILKREPTKQEFEDFLKFCLDNIPIMSLQGSDCKIYTNLVD